MAESALRRLAGHYGIALEHTDGFGGRHVVEEATLRALLQAMGCAVDTGAEARASLRAAEQRRASRMVAPVVTCVQARPAAIELDLHGELRSGTLNWRLSADGAARDGRAPIGRLRAISRERGGLHRCLWRPRFDVAIGRYRLELRAEGGGRQIEGAAELIVAPARCFTPADLGRGRLWGLSVQLHALRSGTNWGMGDLGDLGRMVDVAAGLGAATLGLNPLHALFPADPGRIGPYSPSSRRFLNVLYIDVSVVPELARCPEAQALIATPAWRQRLEAARTAELIDHAAVAALKLPILELLYARFQADELAAGSARAGAFRAFVAEGGAAIARQACFDALQEHALATGIAPSWPDWPAALRDPESAEVAAFARAHAKRIGFHQYLQWLADEQVGHAQKRALAAEMPVGLYSDLAIGVAPDGAMTWANPGVAVTGASVGAPPDAFNPRGQNWGLAPLSPVGLSERAYRPLADDLRCNMRHAGALRVDHVMGLQRLYWIPDGAPPAAGAYVRYPLADLVRVLALESVRQRCLVIGEDLGTVPPGFRRTMAAAGILSYRLLYFERTNGGGFRPPRRYPANALVAVSTHDLPTLAGFWDGRDLVWRERLDLWPDAAAGAAARTDRGRDRRWLVATLRRAGLLTGAVDADAPLSAALLLAVHRFLADAPSALLMVQIEDTLGEVEQANLPGTVDQHPNWRRKLPVMLDELAAHALLRRLADAMNEAGRSAQG